MGNQQQQQQQQQQQRMMQQVHQQQFYPPQFGQMHGYAYPQQYPYGGFPQQYPQQQYGQAQGQYNKMARQQQAAYSVPPHAGFAGYKQGYAPQQQYGAGAALPDACFDYN